MLPRILELVRQVLRHALIVLDERKGGWHCVRSFLDEFVRSVDSVYAPARVEIVAPSRTCSTRTQ